MSIARLFKFAGLALCIGALNACAPTRPAIEKQHFLLQPQAPAAVASRADTPMLRIGRFSIAPQFDTKSMIYRRDEWRYETDFYNEYLASPTHMLANRCAQWLGAGGDVRIAIPGNGERARYELNAAINSFYIDLRTQPTAVLDIRFTLADTANASMLVLDKDYRARVVAAGTTAENNAAAMSQALEEILLKLDRDLAALK
jgi:ABC-type uncharacterized transport system auxiliary subunit